MLLWSVISVLGLLGGAVGAVFYYLNDSSTLARWIEAAAPKYVTSASLTVDRVRLRPISGDITINHLKLWQTINGRPHETLRLPWLSIKQDNQAITQGRFEPREIVVTQPILRLCRRTDGSWNLQGLLADPWPGGKLKTLPKVSIHNGTVELYEEDERASIAVLRDVMVEMMPGPDEDDLIQFRGDARGDSFERLRLEGTYERSTQRLTLAGDLAGLGLDETLVKRVPSEYRGWGDRVRLSGGVLDVSLKRFVHDPGADMPWSYELTGHVQNVTLNSPELPFPVSELHGSIWAGDGVLSVTRLEGIHGKTTVRTWGTFDLEDLAAGPMDLNVDVIDLDIDTRLRDWTSPSAPASMMAMARELWDQYQPKGRLSLALHAAREHQGGPVGFGLGVESRDFGLRYHLFPYQLEHVNGTLSYEAPRITFDMHTLIGGKPAWGRGTIDHPGPDAEVRLAFGAEAMPVDKALLEAMPPDVRQVVDQFQPTGMAEAKASVTRHPPTREFPKGNVEIHAWLDLNDRCSITWAGLPYPVSNLKGKLEIHPDSWVFKDMQGSNGQAMIQGSGRVKRVGRRPSDLDVALHVRAENLPFDQQLRDALPPEWQKTWSTLNPAGTSTVDASIEVAPGREHYLIAIDPGPETRVRLELPPLPGMSGDTPSQPKQPAEPVRLPVMEDVVGTFVYEDGTVSMAGVGFNFRGSPVNFETGTVKVEKSGKFHLVVRDLAITDFRLDAGLRALMPPVMAQFTRRFSDEAIAHCGGDLAIGWSGNPGELAWCAWENGLVVLNGNTIQTGFPIEHLQGQIEQLKGGFDGRNLSVLGQVVLDSVTVLGQQVTRLTTPIFVKEGRAGLSEIKGVLLGGRLGGKVDLTLDSTPKYNLSLQVHDAELQRFTKTVPGTQSLQGQVSGWLTLNGIGNDSRSIQGRGEAHVRNAQLGELPPVLRLVELLKLRGSRKTAFDTADVALVVENGMTNFNPIRFSGDAVTLEGGGTLDTSGLLDLRLQPRYGRDRLRFPLISDALREAGGQFLVVRVTGSPSVPKYRLEPLPTASDAVKSLGNRLTNPTSTR